MKFWILGQMVYGHHEVQLSFGKVLTNNTQVVSSIHRDYATKYKSGSSLVLKEVSLSIVSIP